MHKNENKTNNFSQKERKKIVLKMSFSNKNSDYYFMYKTCPVTTVYMTVWTNFIILQSLRIGCFSKGSFPNINRNIVSIYMYIRNKVMDLYEYVSAHSESICFGIDNNLSLSTLESYTFIFTLNVELKHKSGELFI